MGNGRLILAGGLAAALAVVHLVAGKLRFLDVVPRSRWLSVSGGVSVAYVFVHVMPDLAAGQRTLRETAGGALGFVEHHVYLVALAGMVSFYGLERLAKRSRAPRGDEAQAEVGASTSAGVFWVHAASFAVYNALIGYLLLHREEKETGGLLLFWLAMATHFLVNDHGLREHHKHRYDRLGRWILAAAVLLGFAAGALVKVHRAAVAVLFAFIAGGVVLNVLKEELPEERQSRFWAFAAGAAAYAALLILL